MTHYLPEPHTRPATSKALEIAFQRMEAFWQGYMAELRKLPASARKGMVIFAAAPSRSIGPDWSTTPKENKDV